VRVLIVHSPRKITVIAFEKDSRTLVLVFEEVLVGANFLATHFLVSAFELQLSQQVARHPVHLPKHGLVTAVGTLNVLSSYPLVHASSANCLLTLLALERFIQDHVTDATEKFRDESTTFVSVCNFGILVTVAIHLLDRGFHLNNN